MKTYQIKDLLTTQSGYLTFKMIKISPGKTANLTQI